MTCKWVTNEVLEQYHDEEHGILTKDNKKLFELLTLEIFQPGLSWNVVLTKRGGLKHFFKDYDLNAIADMTDIDIEQGLDNPNIIRHRQKIESVINNAKVIIDNNIDLYTYLLRNLDYRQGIEKLPILLSKQMKKDGFKFVGPSVTQSLLEALGLMPCHDSLCEHNLISKNTIVIDTPWSPLVISYQNYQIIECSYVDILDQSAFTPANSFEQYIYDCIDDYIQRNNQHFKFNIKLDGTDFQMQAWDIARNTNFGDVMTYGDVAWTMGTGANRAVGSAFAKCPYALIIPAHRIVGKNNIGGFQGKTELKRSLLNHEGNDY